MGVRRRLPEDVQGRPRRAGVLAEKKPAELWEVIVVMLDAKMVVDLSPGSGAVGRACLLQSAPCVAGCGSEAHRTWLGNALDREACELITRDKSPLFETDIAESSKTHFQGVLDHMEDMKRNTASDDNDEEEGEVTAPTAAA